MRLVTLIRLVYLLLFQWFDYALLNLFFWMDLYFSVATDAVLIFKVDDVVTIPIRVPTTGVKKEIEMYSNIPM